MILEPKEFYAASLKAGASKGEFLLSVALLTSDLNPINIAFNNGFKPWFRLDDEGMSIVLNKEDTIKHICEELQNGSDEINCKFTEVFKLINFLAH